MKTLKKELKAVALYSKSFFEQYIRPELVYHNLEHTKSVVSNAKKISKDYKLSDEEYFITIASAWMHDLGYYFNNNATNHELESAKLAMAFLREKGVEEHIIEGVKNCILATKLPQTPKNLPEEILCDADLFHLGTDDFMEDQRLLKTEMEYFKQSEIAKSVWLNDTLQLMHNHNYHTSFCQNLLTKSKAKNIKKIIEKVEQQEKKGDTEPIAQPAEAAVNEVQNVDIKPTSTRVKTRAKSAQQNIYAIAKPVSLNDAHENITQENGIITEPTAILESKETVVDTFSEDKNNVSEVPEVAESDIITYNDMILHKSDNDYLFFKKKTEKKEKGKKKTGRGVETVFKVTSSNNQRLSGQADSKAHIMITVNSIIVSVLITVLLRKIEDVPNLLIPTLILLVVNVSTIIFSVLATRPNIPSGMFTDNDVQTKKVNLLFFGNFYKMNLENYSKGMLTMMDDTDFLYGSLIQDVYNQGIVLAKKYKLLRISYTIFMYGLIVSVLAFVVFTFAGSNESVIH